MSIKTIAVDSGVYLKLAACKASSESFSKAIGRLIANSERAHTGADILASLGDVTGLRPEESEIMEGLVAESRRTEDWSRP